MKNSVRWKEQEGRGEKGEAISIRGEETGWPTLSPVPHPFLGPEQHQQLGRCRDCCILSQVCCTSSHGLGQAQMSSSLHCGSSDPTLCDSFMASLMFMVWSFLGWKSKRLLFNGHLHRAVEVPPHNSPLFSLPRPPRTRGPAGLMCCWSWPLLLLHFPPSPSPSLPLSLSSSSSPGSVAVSSGVFS